MEKLWVLMFLFLLSTCATDAARILVVFACPSKSHSILGHAFVSTLLDAGHEVTYITPYPRKNLQPNLHEIDVSEIIDIWPAHIVNFKNILDNNGMGSAKEGISSVLNIPVAATENEGVQKLMNDPSQQFDAVVYEWMMSEFYSGLSAVFECPLIIFSSLEPHWIVMDLIDEALHPVYNADLILGQIPPYNFKQRVTQLLTQLGFKAFSNFWMVPGQIKEYERVFGPVAARRGITLPPFDDLRHNASLLFGNSHVSLGQATRLPQSYKPIGGYHIDPKVKPLPEDLRQIMDKATAGVIYFSMGTIVNSKDMPEEIKKGLLTVFGGLKYTVIWKFEENFPDVPENVHIVQWAPQQSILSHPNCIMFITHGGLLSTTETVYHGVPVIAIPVFADQFMNADRAVDKGYGMRVDLSYTMAEDLKSAIQEITSNPKYAEKAKENSFVFHHRPSSPRAELVHWVEHVVRTRGARHLRSPALLVPWYQKMYLDLVGVILAIIIVLRYTFTRLFCRNKKVDVGKKNK